MKRGLEYMNIQIGSKQNGTVRKEEMLAGNRIWWYLCSAFALQLMLIKY